MVFDIFVVDLLCRKVSQFIMQFQNVFLENMLSV